LAVTNTGVVARICHLCNTQNESAIAGGQ
jgi:hypothetical protein